MAVVLNSICDVAVCPKPPHQVLVATTSGTVYLFADANTPTDVNWGCHGGGLRVGWADRQPLAWNADSTSHRIWVLMPDGRIIQYPIPTDADVAPCDDGFFVARNSIQLEYYELSRNGTVSCEKRDRLTNYQRASLCASRAGAVAFLNGDEPQVFSAAFKAQHPVATRADAIAISPSGARLATSLFRGESGSYADSHLISDARPTHETRHAVRALPVRATDVQWSDDDAMLLFYARAEEEVRLFVRDGWAPGLWCTSAITPRFHPEGVLTVPGSRDGLILQPFRGRSPKTWTRTVKKEDAADFDIGGVDELRRGDKVVAFVKQPRLRPTGVYEVVSGPRKDEDTRGMPNRACKCFIRLGLPHFTDNALDVEAPVLDAIAATMGSEIDIAEARGLLERLLRGHPTELSQLPLHLPLAAVVKPEEPVAPPAARRPDATEDAAQTIARADRVEPVAGADVATRATRLPANERSVLDVIANRQLAAGEGPSADEILLNWPHDAAPTVRESIGALIDQALVTTGRLSSGHESLHLTATGLLASRYTGRASEVAEAVLQFFKRRMIEQTAAFRSFEWSDLRSAGVGRSNEELPLVRVTLQVLDLGQEREYSHEQLYARWDPPTDLVELRGLSEIDDLRARVERRRAENDDKAMLAGPNRKRPSFDRATAVADAIGVAHVLAVGVSDYLPSSGFKNLRQCVHDAQQFASCFRIRQELRSSAETTHELTSAGPGVPSKGRVVHEVRALASRANAEDRLIFYFSGHGHRINDQLYLVPGDAWIDDNPEALISLEAVNGFLSNSLAKIKIVILDACNTGPSLSDVKHPAAQWSEKFLAEYIGASRGVVTLASSLADQPSSTKSPHPNLSLFTNFVVNALNGEPEALDGGLLTVDSFFNYVSAHVQRVSKSHHRAQQPARSGASSGMIVLGDFREPKKTHEATPLEVADPIDASSVREDVLKQGTRPADAPIVSRTMEEDLRPYEPDGAFHPQGGSLAERLSRQWPPRGTPDRPNRKLMLEPNWSSRRLDHESISVAARSITTRFRSRTFPAPSIEAIRSSASADGLSWTAPDASWMFGLGFDGSFFYQETLAENNVPNAPWGGGSVVGGCATLALFVHAYRIFIATLTHTKHGTSLLSLKLQGTAGLQLVCDDANNPTVAYPLIAPPTCDRHQFELAVPITPETSRAKFLDHLVVFSKQLAFMCNRHDIASAILTGALAQTAFTI